MKVTLIDSTENPVEKLIFTKGTRLNMSASRMEDIENMTTEEKKAEIMYMINTIKSSWEFVNFTFMIEGVSRAFTHQFVRNRQGSYAQQTMRILDVSGFDYVTGPGIKTEYQKDLYKDAMESIQASYNDLISSGVPIEDARGILPTNICTNIVAQFNLRTLSDMFISRSSSRTQGEFRDVIEAMYQAIVTAHPWAELFLRDNKFAAAKSLESTIHDRFDGTDQLIPLIKLLDVLRK